MRSLFPNHICIVNGERALACMYTGVWQRKFFKDWIIRRQSTQLRWRNHVYTCIYSRADVIILIIYFYYLRLLVTQCTLLKHTMDWLLAGAQINLELAECKFYVLQTISGPIVPMSGHDANAYMCNYYFACKFIKETFAAAACPNDVA